MPLFVDPLFISIAFGHLMVDIFNASRPVLLAYLGLSETNIAIISTIYIWVSALTQPFFGWWTDRFGPRWFAALGVLWMTIFYSAALLLPGNAGLLCLVIAALGSSSYHPVGTVQAALRGHDLMKERETTATSIFFMAGQIGHFVGPILTGLFLAWKGVPLLLIFPLVSLPVFFSLAYQLRANVPHPQYEKSKSYLKVGAGFIVVLAVVATFQSWVQSNMVNLMPKYFKDMGLAATTYGNMTGLFMGGSALGNVIGGTLADRHPKRFVASSALFLAAIPIFIISKIGWSNWLYLLVPLAGALTGAVHSIMVVLAVRIIPGGMALVSGLALGFIFSSGALGLLLTGPIMEQRGFPFVLTMTTALVLIASPLALMLKEK